MNKLMIVVGVVVVAIIAIALSLSGIFQTPSQTGTRGGELGTGAAVGEDVEVTTTGTQEQPTTHTVEMSSSGFSPQTLTIRAGDTVNFVNVGSSFHQPASNPHPAHTGYPGSSLAKCNTAQENEAFDACRAVEPGGTYSFTFLHIGTWGYHDHLNGIRTGTIIVEE